MRIQFEKTVKQEKKQSQYYSLLFRIVPQGPVWNFWIQCRSIEDLIFLLKRFLRVQEPKQTQSVKKKSWIMQVDNVKKEYVCLEKEK